MIKIRSFLGMACYYRRFKERFSKPALSTAKLLHKSNRFEWIDESGNSFQELKKRLLSTPILIISKENKGSVIYSDASKKRVGCVLM